MMHEPMRIFVATRPVDLRAGFDRLAAYTRGLLREDPRSGSLFVFLNRRGNRLKALWWDGNGYAVLYKRLSRGSFARIRSESGRWELSAEQFSSLVAALPLPGPSDTSDSGPRILH